MKIKPQNIQNAVPAALLRNGYNEKEWADAISLEEGIKIYAEKTKDCIFCAYNATFDWGFMSDAFKKTGIKNEMDYHRLDLLTLAWEKGLKNKESWSLKTSCELFGVPKEPDLHRALDGTMTAYKLFKKLESR